MTSIPIENQIAAYKAAKEKITWLIVSLKEEPIDAAIWLKLHEAVTDCEWKIIELQAAAKKENTK